MASRPGTNGPGRDESFPKRCPPIPIMELDHMTFLTRLSRRIAQLLLAAGLALSLLTTVNPAPADAAGPTQYTTTALNVRTGPGTRHPVVTILKKGAKVTLSGRFAGNWRQLTNRRWVHSNYLTPKRASTTSRCQRAAVDAANRIGLRQLPRYTCWESLPGGLPTGTVGATVFVYGSLAQTKVYISEPHYHRWSYAQLRAVFAHEFGHVLYATASSAKREAAVRALGASQATMHAGPYSNQMGERFAQAAAVCTGLTTSWSVYTPLSCSSYSRAAAALR
ncbi:MAG: SH3 domain-containing protein [Propioniciclava sp.]